MSHTNIKTRVVGVDIDVKRTTYAIVDIRGNIIAEDYFVTSDYPNVNEYVTTLTEKILTLVEANGGYETIRSVGMSGPSANFVTGCIENASNMPWKGRVPLAAMLRDQLGMAVALGNDAYVSALGEKVFGSAHGMRDFIVVTLSHGGVGSSVFSNGNPHLGNDGFAGEFGHTVVVEGGRHCGCGKHGCLEPYVSERGVLATARELLNETDEPSLLRQAGDITLPVLVDCCEKGDRVAIETFRRTGFMLGMALANYASLLNPEAIILTGPLTKSGEWLLEPTTEAFDAHVFHNVKGKVKLLVSILDDHERDVLGASALAWDVKEYSLFK